MKKITQFFDLKKVLPVMVLFAVLVTVFSFGSYDPYNELTVLTPENAEAALVAGSVAAAKSTGASAASSPSSPSGTTFVCNLSVNTNNVEFGGFATVSWNVQGYGPVTLTINGQPQSVANSGDQTLYNIQENQTITIFAQADGSTCSQEVIITCEQPPTPICVSFTANPVSGPAGSARTLTWDTQNGTHVSINQGVGSNLPLDGTIQVAPLQTTIYTLTVRDDRNNSVNCHVTVEVTPQTIDPICDSFTAQPSVITPGGNSRLTWASTNGVTAAISPGFPSVTPVDGGFVEVNPTVTTDYTFVVFGANNNSDYCNVTVTVIETQTAPICVSFTVNPASGAPGSQRTLSWTTQNGNTASINQGVGPVALNDSTVVSPTVSTAYTLTVIGDNFQSDTCLVNVIVIPTTPLVPECLTFTASPISGASGSQRTLTWTTQNATGASIGPGVGAVAVNGNTTVNPTVTTTYTLLLTGANNQTANCNVTVTVVPTTPTAPVCVSFTATPTSGTPGSARTLSWTTQNATQASISGGVGSVAVPSGSVVVNPSVTTTYTLLLAGANNQTANCNVTVTVVPTTPVEPVCISFVVDVASGPSGSQRTLSWETRNATQASISAGVGSVSDRLPNGSITVNPTVTTTYTLLLTSASGESANCNVTVTVVPTTPVEPVCISFLSSITPVVLSANADEAAKTQRDHSYTLSWETRNAVSATISPTVGSVSDRLPNGSVVVRPTVTTTYTLTLTSATGQQTSCSVEIIVTPPAALTCENNVNFSASPTSIRRGNDSTLTWSTTGVTSVRFDNGITATGLSGSVTVSPSNSTTYNLTASNGREEVTCPVRVTVTTGGGGGGTRTPRCELSISKNRISPGESVRLVWETSNATGLTLEDRTARRTLVDTDGLLSRDRERLLDDDLTVSPRRDTTYVLTVTRGSRERTCTVDVRVGDNVVVTQVRDQQPLVSGIALTQVPYTGFEAGPILTVIFYLLLMAWALYIAYILVIKRDTLGGLALAKDNNHNTDPIIHEDRISTNVSASQTAVAEPVSAPSFLPDNLPVDPVVVGYANVATDSDVEDDNNLDVDETTSLENYAHSQRVLISSDAIRHFAGLTEGVADKNSVLDKMIVVAKENYPTEDGWVVLNEKRMRELATLVSITSAAAEKVTNEAPAVIPTGSGSLAEAIVTGNVVAAYEMIGRRPMFALADAAADLDAVYRLRRSGEGKASDLLVKETKTLTDEQILAMIAALTGALDGVYTDEAAAVKMAIMKAIKIVA